MTRRTRTIVALGLLVAISLALAVARPRVTRQLRPVVCGTGCACGEFHDDVTGYVLWNPLRDIAPERTVDKFLGDLKAGKCSSKADLELCRYALDQTRPVSDWRLVNRKTSSNGFDLFYRFNGKHRPGLDLSPQDAWGEGRVQVERIGNEWKVKTYSVYY